MLYINTELDINLFTIFQFFIRLQPTLNIQNLKSYQLVPCKRPTKITTQYVKQKRVLHNKGHNKQMDKPINKQIDK